MLHNLDEIHGIPHVKANQEAAMREFRSRWQAVAIALLLGAGCAESGGENSAADDASSSDISPATTSVTAIAETDSDIYSAADSAIATFRNLGHETLYLPGCSPFVFEQSLDGTWGFVGQPLVCFWEGFAVAIGANEIDEFEFMVPNVSGIYRLRYDYSSGCEPDLPLSQANCEAQAVAYSNEFEVERELCDPAEFNCQFVPGAPNFLCADGVNFAGPSGECTRDPASGVCGYEILHCP